MIFTNHGFYPKGIHNDSPQSSPPVPKEDIYADIPNLKLSQIDADSALKQRKSSAFPSTLHRLTATTSLSSSLKSKNYLDMKIPASAPALVSVLERNTIWPPPIWLMRQAGRYLPEYQAVRKTAGSFWRMCMTPELAMEVTLQPIRRFDFDAAILFSDILVIPHALGQMVRFEEGEGPRLTPLTDSAAIDALPKHVDQSVLAPVYETVRRVRGMLDADVTLLGFCG